MKVLAGLRKIAPFQCPDDTGMLLDDIDPVDDPATKENLRKPPSMVERLVGYRQETIVGKRNQSRVELPVRVAESADFDNTRTRVSVSDHAIDPVQDLDNFRRNRHLG